jgi:hypothetical protein
MCSVEEKENEDVPSLPHPKPRPLHQQPSISASDADAAELLMDLGAAARKPVRRNPYDKVFDAVMGLTQKERDELDADQYGAADDNEDFEDDSGPDGVFDASFLSRNFLFISRQ